MDVFRDALVIGVVEGFPTWAITAFGALTIVFLMAHGYVGYAYGSVAAILAIVEDTSPSADINSTSIVEDEGAEALSPYRDEADSDAEAVSEPSAQEQLLVTTNPMKPITSSIRDTFKHLERETNSRFARMRAFRVFGMYSGSASLLGLTIRLLFGNFPIILVLSAILGECALLGLNTLWIHVVISKPRNVRPWKRILGRKELVKILPPGVIWSVVQALPLISGGALAVLLFPSILSPPEDPNEFFEPVGFAFTAKLLLILGVTLSLLVLVAIPARVILVRCQAALLSEDETPIVPFDCTFGGRVASDGSLSMRNAWRSFDRNDRLRIGRIYLVMIGLLSLFWILYTAGIISIAVILVRNHRDKEL